MLSFLILSVPCVQPVSVPPWGEERAPSVHLAQVATNLVAEDEEDGWRGWLPAGGRLAQYVIEQRVIIRVPMMRGRRPAEERGEDRPPPEKMEWEERKGPRCVQVTQLRAASLSSSQAIDLMLRDSTRLRARFNRDCRAEDLYSGFYVRPDEDGFLCAGRDRVLARSGASCLITDFRRLTPKR